MTEKRLDREDGGTRLALQFEWLEDAGHAPNFFEWNIDRSRVKGVPVMAGETSILQTLLGDTPVQHFFEQHYLKLPFASPRGASALVEHVCWETIERFLFIPNVDAIAGCQGERWKGGQTPSPQISRQLMEDGYTIGIRHVQQHGGPLQELARSFEEAFAAPVDVHLYCTPAGHVGFGWHYDAEEVFIMQCQGEKEWCLRKNTVHPWPLIEAIPANQRYEQEIMPMLQCQLKTGDWLYIPNGYWHRTKAESESISLSIGVRALTAIDVYDALRQVLIDSLQWRQRLPCLGNFTGRSNAEHVENYQQLFESLGNDLQQKLSERYFIERFVSERMASPTDATPAVPGSSDSAP